MASERRRSDRVDALGALGGEVAVIEPTEVWQMSRGGMLVETEFPLQVDSLHEFRLPLGPQSVVVKGRVVHSRVSDVGRDVMRYRFGVEFVAVSERVATAIDEFLRNVSSQSPGSRSARPDRADGSGD